METVIDITRPITPGMTIYPGNPEVVFQTTQIASASSSALTKMTLGSHTGTHIDAPSHIESGGANTDAYTLNAMIGQAEVIDLSALETIITAHDLPPTTKPRILLKTRNSSDPLDQFNPNFIALDESAAHELVKRGLTLIGIDGPSIKKKGVKDMTHQILLQAGIVILEGVQLINAPAGTYELLCLPLAVSLDGAPVRAILRSSAIRI